MQIYRNDKSWKGHTHAHVHTSMCARTHIHTLFKCVPCNFSHFIGLNIHLLKIQSWQTNFIKQSHSWKANNHLPGQEIPHHFMKPQLSISYSWQTATAPCSEPDEWSSCPVTLLFKTILILSSPKTAPSITVLAFLPDIDLWPLWMAAVISKITWVIGFSK